MSGFGSGAYGSTLQDLVNQVQSNGQFNNNAGSAGSAGGQTPAAGAGPGEPNNFNYGGMGNYNTLTQDMSRNVMGPWGFSGNQFSYSPYGNPYQQQPMGGQPGTQPTQPPIMGGGGYNGGYGGGGGFGGRYGGGYGGYGGGGYGGYGGGYGGFGGGFGRGGYGMW